MVRWTCKDENLRSQGESESVGFSVVFDSLGPHRLYPTNPQSMEFSRQEHGSR